MRRAIAHPTRRRAARSWLALRECPWAQALAGLAPDPRLAVPARLRAGCSSSGGRPCSRRSPRARSPSSAIPHAASALAWITCSRSSRSFGGCACSPCAPRCCTARRSRPRLRCAVASTRSARLRFELTRDACARCHTCRSCQAEQWRSGAAASRAMAAGRVARAVGVRARPAACAVSAPLGAACGRGGARSVALTWRHMGWNGIT